jgi:hypothetical protein
MIFKDLHLESIVFHPPITFMEKEVTIRKTQRLINDLPVEKTSVNNL